MKTKITLGKSVSISVRKSVWSSVYDSVNSSVDNSVWSSVYDSLRSSINNSMIWGIEL